MGWVGNWAWRPGPLHGAASLTHFETGAHQVTQALNFKFSCVSLLGGWDDRCMPPLPAWVCLFFGTRNQTEDLVLVRQVLVALSYIPGLSFS